MSPETLGIGLPHAAERGPSLFVADETIGDAVNEPVAPAFSSGQSLPRRRPIWCPHILPDRGLECLLDVRDAVEGVLDVEQ